MQVQEISQGRLAVRAMIGRRKSPLTFPQARDLENQISTYNLREGSIQDKTRSQRTNYAYCTRENDMHEGHDQK